MHTPRLISVKTVLNSVSILQRQNNIFQVKCDYCIGNTVRNILRKVDEKI
jgi:hypothetical protein